MGYIENPKPKNPKPKWDPPPQPQIQKARSIHTGMPVNAVIYNLTLMLCGELKRKKPDQEMINRITAILPKLILRAEQNQEQKITNEDLQKLYKDEVKP